MTITQAVRLGVSDLHDRKWTPLAHLHLNLIRRSEPVEAGKSCYTVGVWADLYDPVGRWACGEPPDEPLRVPLLDMPGGCPTDEDAYEPWQKPDDYEQQIIALKQEPHA